VRNGEEGDQTKKNISLHHIESFSSLFLVKLTEKKFPPFKRNQDFLVAHLVALKMDSVGSGWVFAFARRFKLIIYH
jgi:hypothetical protein